jgi:tungstate transport system permease protein
MVWEITEGIASAFNLILSGDPTLIDITLRSLQVSGLATILSALWSLPLGLLVGIKSFRGKRLVKAVFTAAIGIPTVGLGLILYLLLSHSGPLGIFGLLYSPTAIIIGEAVLVTPIILSFTISAIEAVEPEIKDLARSMGASEFQASAAVFKEGLSGIILAVTASFNRAIAELGVALMLGGNIRGLTRVLTTSIALETTKGEIVLSVALTAILLIIVFILSLAVSLLRRK